MNRILHGKNIIAGEPSAAGRESTRAVNPATGEEMEPDFIHAIEAEVQRAAERAEKAQVDMLRINPLARARLLRRIAEEITALGDSLIERCRLETALPEARLISERARTVNQLRMFADMVEEGSWVDARIDTAIPDRKPQPRPDLRRMLLPLGVAAVFCAGNFPLAFSVVGGDTASALAGGCSVIVKAHGSHPGTAELAAKAVKRAVAAENLPSGVFSLLHGPGATIGVQLVTHPLIKAVGFTGSRRAGRALFNAAASRDEPIPVFAEMGSINPVFLLPEALRKRNEPIAQGLFASATVGVGQFCTNPGVVIALDSEELDELTRRMGRLFSQAQTGIMLNERILTAYRQGSSRLRTEENVSLGGEGAGAAESGGSGRPALFTSDGRTFLENPLLREELFGPCTLLIRSRDREQMMRIAASLEGQLTASVHAEEGEVEEYAELFTVLRCKAGRLIFNSFPTGVEVCRSMHHGGPYPATTDSRFTSVGTAAVYRFARPVCFQDFPESTLPPELRDANPLGILRQLNGVYTRDSISR